MTEFFAESEFSNNSRNWQCDIIFPLAFHIYLDSISRMTINQNLEKNV